MQKERRGGGSLFCYIKQKNFHSVQPGIIQLLTSAGSLRNSRSSNGTPCFYNTKDNEQTFIVYYRHVALERAAWSVRVWLEARKI